MSKIRRIHDFQHSFTFSSQTEEFDAFYAWFLESDLGKVYLAVPWEELVRSFGLGASKIFAENKRMELLNEDGSMNSIAKMIIDLLGSVAGLEIEAIKERQN
jgi:hypothetical protein